MLGFSMQSTVFETVQANISQSYLRSRKAQQHYIYEIFICSIFLRSQPESSFTKSQATIELKQKGLQDKDEEMEEIRGFPAPVLNSAMCFE